MKAMNLTVRQSEVHGYIKRYIETNNVSPFIREIQEGCGINSYKAAVDKLLILEKKGFIKRELNKHRGIKISPSTFSGKKPGYAQGDAEQGRSISPSTFSGKKSGYAQGDAEQGRSISTF